MTTGNGVLTALLPWIVGLPALAALVAAGLPTRARTAAAVLAGGACLVVFGFGFACMGALEAGAVLRGILPWAPSLGLILDVRVDGLAWLFVMLVSGFGVLIAAYARSYMPADDPASRFFAYLLGFTAAMLGVVTSGNALQLVVFWELTSLFSFLLVGFWFRNAEARAAARYALLVTAGGGLCLLGGVLVLGRIVGSFDLDRILAAGPQVAAHPLMPLALVPILVGAFAKSAQFPFQGWLPRAMAAPTPVSAFLHSATLVKAGPFLLARIWPVFSETDLWLWLVGGAGLITLLLGAWRAMIQDDLKALLAQSTLSHLGLMTLLLGLGAPLAAFAALVHLVNHAIFKAALFMSAGAIEHETGTRSLRALGGLRRRMPVTAVLTVIAASAMAGAPFFSGFVSKEMFFAEIARFGEGWTNLALIAAATLAGALSVAYALRLCVDLFLGPETEAARDAHEAPWLMRAPIAVLALGCLVIGIAPALALSRILDLGAARFLDTVPSAEKLVLWHGFGPPLVMSLLAFVLGAAAWHGLRRRGEDGVARERGDRAGLGARLEGGVRRVEAWLGAARLQRHVLMICLTVAAAGMLALGWGGWTFVPIHPQFDPAFAGLWIAGLACAIGAVVFAGRRRVAALVLTGGAGLATAVTFTWISSPDLAITQLLVEVVTAILLLLGLRWLPQDDGRREAKRSPPMARIRDAAIAVVLGLGAGALAYGVMTYPTPDAVSRFYLDMAYDGSGGRNAVNVILVDFRGFDTLGEITVVAIVALAVAALLRRFQPPNETVRGDAGEQGGGSPPERHKDLIVPGTIIKLMFPAVVLFGLHLFLRGHDLPGGGFAGGVTISAALLLLYMALGVRQVEARLRIRPIRWMAVGLLIAALTGVAAMAAGRPFLTSAFTYLRLGELPALPLASAMLFDLGVLMLVVGAVAAMLVTIAHQSQRRPMPVEPEEG